MLGTMSAQTIRFPISPAASLVVNDLYFPLASAPAAFWAAVRSDGGDIRVTTQDGVTQCAREIVGFDYANKTGSLFFAANGGSAFYISAGSGEDEPAADAAIGKYGVWESSLRGVWHMQDFSDSTSNQFHGTPVTDITSSVGKCGGAKSFPAGSMVGMTTAATTTGLQHATFFFWLKRALNARNTVGCSDGGANRAEVLTYSDNAAYAEISDSQAKYGRVSSAPYGSDWHRFCMAFDGTKATNAERVKLYIDSVQQTLIFNADTATTIAAVSGFALNTRYTLNDAGEYDEVRLYTRTLEQPEVCQLYANQNDPASFWTVGAPG